MELKSFAKPRSQLDIDIKITRNEDLFQQIGRDIYFDLVDPDKVRSLRVPRRMLFNSFKVVVAKQFGIPVQLQRFWLWGTRLNHTYRPNKVLTHQEDALSVEQLWNSRITNKKAELILFLDVELGLDLYTISSPNRTREDILIFFKLYDPVKEELRYLGRLFVKGSGKPVEILNNLKEMAGFAADEEIKLYEEISFEPTVTCDLIYINLTFRNNELGNGDIICLQKLPPVESQTKCRYPDVPSFMEYVNLQGDKKNLGAGQPLEEGGQGVPDEKFQDIEGFSVLKTQASLYKQIWLKYGHIATDKVLTDSYSGQVALVTDIMTFIMDMNNCHFTELSSAMIDSWEKKIKMAEKIEFNIRWLRECFEDVKKDFFEEHKLETVLLEQNKSLQAAKVRVMEAKDVLEKAEEDMSALEASISSLLADKQMYLEKGSRLLLDGLL